jgi:hypothetical protein
MVSQALDELTYRRANELAVISTGEPNVLLIVRFFELRSSRVRNLLEDKVCLLSRGRASRFIDATKSELGTLSVERNISESD